MSLPPLTPLHSDDTLVSLKLELFRRLTTEELRLSLRPGEPSALKVRPDGTILDGHHRLKVLHERNVDIDALPREIIGKGKQDEDNLLD